MTEYRRIDAAEADRRGGAVAAAAAALESGAILAHPTATVYGLGAARPSLDGVIARMKGRDPDRPLLRIAADEEAVRRQHPEIEWTGEGERLARCFWPGPVTLVLPDGTEQGLAIRVEAHPVTRAVLERAGTTMSSTSLNRSGRAPARTAEEVEAVLETMPAVDTEVVWLDVGPLDPSAPSTLVSLLGERPRVLREGAVAAGEIEACLQGARETE